MKALPTLVVLVLLLVVAPASAEGLRFVPLDVFVDTGGQRMAAYQLEVRLHGAEIAGVEGGDVPAFAAAPYYDPAALRGNRIKLAAFSTAQDLPKGRTRVAVLHVVESGGERARWDVASVLATDSAARTIEAHVDVVRRPEGRVK